MSDRFHRAGGSIARLAIHLEQVVLTPSAYRSDLVVELRSRVAPEPSRTEPRNGGVVGWPLCAAEIRVDGGERRCIRAVAVDVSQQAGKLPERRRIEPSVFLNAVARESFGLVRVPVLVGDTVDSTFKCSRFTTPCRDGKIFLYARSPIAPKKTTAPECVSLMVISLCQAATCRPAFQDDRRIHTAWPREACLGSQPRCVS